MTRINGKGPNPPMTLRLTRVDRAPGVTTALYEVQGGPQDGAAYAVAVTLNPAGRPLLAVGTLLTADLKTVIAEGPLHPDTAAALLPPAPDTTPEEKA